MTFELAVLLLPAPLLIAASFIFLAYRRFAIADGWTLDAWHRGAASVLAGLFGLVFAFGFLVGVVPDASVAWRATLLSAGGLLAGLALIGFFRARVQWIAARLWLVALLALVTALATRAG